MTARTPTTEAGRRVMASLDPFVREHWATTILAIEDEARAPLVAALEDANRIIAMTRQHLIEDHPECAYIGLGLLNDADRAALSRTART